MRDFFAFPVCDVGPHRVCRDAIVFHESRWNRVSSNFSTVYKMLLDVVPDNLFTPFTEGNTLQILFIGIITGIMLLIFGEKTRTTANLIEQLQTIVNGIMLFINRLLPLFIFGNIFNMVISQKIIIIKNKPFFNYFIFYRFFT